MEVSLSHEEVRLQAHIVPHLSNDCMGRKVAHKRLCYGDRIAPILDAHSGYHKLTVAGPHPNPPPCNGSQGRGQIGVVSSHDLYTDCARTPYPARPSIGSSGRCGQSREHTPNAHLTLKDLRYRDRTATIPGAHAGHHSLTIAALLMFIGLF